MGIFKKEGKNEEELIREFQKQTSRDLDYFGELLKKLEKGEISERKFSKELSKLTKKQNKFRKELEAI